jgi:hypothetical protein
MRFFPFADPSHKLRALAQGQNDKIVQNIIFYRQFYDNPKGNAKALRVMRTIKEELIWLNEFGSLEKARENIRNWIMNDYNRLYVHSSLEARLLSKIV